MTKLPPDRRAAIEKRAEELRAGRPLRTFEIRWSEEDGECVGLCDQYPSLSHLAATEGEALSGIMRLVAEADADEAKSDD